VLAPSSLRAVSGSLALAKRDGDSLTALTHAGDSLLAPP
jgi:hypothetical protein